MFTSLLLLCVVSTPLLAAADGKVRRLQKKYEKSLKKAKQAYRRGEINDRAFWARLVKLYKYVSKGIAENPSDLLQNQAILLKRDKYNLLAARYASQAIMSSKDPYNSKLTPAWKLLAGVSRESQIHDILVNLASKIMLAKKPPAGFGRNWYYFLAESFIARNKSKLAAKAFRKVKVNDRYWMASRYQMAMSYVFDNDLKAARKVLKQMLDADYNRAADISRYKRRLFIDSAFLAIARVEYENKSYLPSIAHFRQINRRSPLFYESLFEQSWAFFMNGNPNHALGALHSADSPFFDKRFNPEISILRSLIYYWMCRYDDARVALAEFLDVYQKPVAALEGYLKKKNMDPKSAYDLFENLVAGVSEKSLGIDKRLLESVAKNSEMRFVRDRLATVMEEKKRLDLRGVFRSKRLAGRPIQILEDWESALKLELGRVYLAELEDLSDSYRELRSQANFLHIELLMSEKEQALGRELHSENKMADIDLSKKIKGWGKGNQPWKASRLGEYWSDELGYYVYQVQPQCKGQ